MAFFLKRGCDPNASNNDNETALMRADFTKPRIVKLLLDAGANLHVVNSNGQSPLHAAVILGNVESVHLLLTAGADVNHEDNEGISVLKYAIVKSNLGIVELLVRNGVDFDRPMCEIR